MEDITYTKLFEQIYNKAEERFFEEVYNSSKSKEYTPLFENIYQKHLRECKSLSFYTDFKNYKNLILNKSTRDAAVKDIVKKQYQFYVIPVIYKETGLGITPLDLKGKTDNFRTDYWKVGKNYKGALKIFLDSYFEYKFKFPSDCSKNEQSKLYTDFKNTLEDMQQSKK